MDRLCQLHGEAPAAQAAGRTRVPGRAGRREAARRVAVRQLVARLLVGPVAARRRRMRRGQAHPAERLAAAGGHLGPLVRHVRSRVAVDRHRDRITRRPPAAQPGTDPGPAPGGRAAAVKVRRHPRAVRQVPARAPSTRAARPTGDAVRPRTRAPGGRVRMLPHAVSVRTGSHATLAPPVARAERQPPAVGPAAIPPAPGERRNATVARTSRRTWPACLRYRRTLTPTCWIVASALNCARSAN
ncbi:MAG: hypothetical protein QOC66_1554 [Pseudonocardiales bacterium]|nr:hypothetical protein [Pseudonocardiales bacterium]